MFRVLSPIPPLGILSDDWLSASNEVCLRQDSHLDHHVSLGFRKQTCYPYPITHPSTITISTTVAVTSWLVSASLDRSSRRQGLPLRAWLACRLTSWRRLILFYLIDCHISLDRKRRIKSRWRWARTQKMKTGVGQRNVRDNGFFGKSCQNPTAVFVRLERVRMKDANRKREAVTCPLRRGGHSDASCIYTKNYP